MGTVYHRRSHVVVAGMTLTEVLVSIVILAIGLIGLSQLYLAGVLTYRQAQNLSMATRRAQQEVEKAQNLTYNQLTTALTHQTLVPELYPAASYTALPTQNGVRFPVETLPGGTGTVTYTHFNNYPNLLKVEVAVTWQAGHRQSNMTFATLVVNK